MVLNFYEIRRANDNREVMCIGGFNILESIISFSKETGDIQSYTLYNDSKAEIIIDDIKYNVRAV